MRYSPKEPFLFSERIARIYNKQILFYLRSLYHSIYGFSTSTHRWSKTISPPMLPVCS